MNQSKLTAKTRKNLMLALSILWVLCAALLIFDVVLGLCYNAAILQTILHSALALVAVVCAVVNFRRWHKMPTEDEPTEESVEDTLDSTED